MATLLCGNAAACDAQAPAEFARSLSSPAPERPYEMAGVGVAELQCELGDRHLALLQKFEGAPGEDAVQHGLEGGITGVEMTLEGSAGQIYFPGDPFDARPAFEQRQSDEVLDALHEVTRVGQRCAMIDHAGIVRQPRTGIG